MPNDAPDWVRVILNQLAGRGPAFTPLGDVTSPSLAADADTVTAALVPANMGGVLASFKPAAGLTIALRGALGTALAGTSTSVSPLFGQAPVAGSGLVAVVTASASNTEPTTTQAGWVKVVSVNDNGWEAVWVKPNAAGGDTAPTFTCQTAGLSVMMAQLSEWTGMATTSPQENNGNLANSGVASLSLVNSAADAAFGDLVVQASRWNLNQAGTTTFTDAFNNQAVSAGSGTINADFAGSGRISYFSYAIIPAAIVAQPLGVADWAYDVTGTSAPAVGNQASVVLAATPGKTYTLAWVDCTLANVAAAASTFDFQVLDGVTTKITHGAALNATAGDRFAWSERGLAFKGTAGSSMTVQGGGAYASAVQRVNVGAYLR